MYKMKSNRMNGNIHRMKKATSEMKFHYSLLIIGYSREHIVNEWK